MTSKTQETVDFLIQIEGELITAQDAVFHLFNEQFPDAWHFLNEAFHRVNLARRLLEK